MYVFTCTMPPHLIQNAEAVVSKGDINFLTSLEGSGKRNSRSNRPGRRRAGSMASIRLVAPIMTISPRLSRPSMRARRVDTMEEWIWSCRLERTGASPSISSKKIMEGRIWYACVCGVCVWCTCVCVCGVCGVCGVCFMENRRDFIC